MTLYIKVLNQGKPSTPFINDISNSSYEGEGRGDYYSKILLQLYSTGHFITDVTLYQTLESGEDTDQTTVAMSHNKLLLDTVGKECKGSTELVNRIKSFIANKIRDINKV